MFAQSSWLPHRKLELDYKLGRKPGLWLVFRGELFAVYIPVHVQPMV